MDPLGLWYMNHLWLGFFGLIKRWHLRTARRGHCLSHDGCGNTGRRHCLTEWD